MGGKWRQCHLGWHLLYRMPCFQPRLLFYSIKNIISNHEELEEHFHNHQELSSNIYIPTSFQDWTYKRAPGTCLSDRFWSSPHTHPLKWQNHTHTCKYDQTIRMGFKITMQKTYYITNESFPTEGKANRAAVELCWPRAHTRTFRVLENNKAQKHNIHPIQIYKGQGKLSPVRNTKTHYVL